MSDLINQSVNDEAVCRTAPATQGLSKIHTLKCPHTKKRKAVLVQFVEHYRKDLHQYIDKRSINSIGFHSRFSFKIDKYSMFLK